MNKEKERFSVKEWKDIVFKTIGDRKLEMNISVPEDVKNPPVILWVHGGGWNELNRLWSLITPMLELGYAVASVEYRYSDEAAFPAQIIDLKDALAFIKKHGGQYGYDADRVIVSGDSAGAHLATLLGFSEGVRAWEKENEDYSAQAVVDFCGPVDLAKALPYGTKAGTYKNMEAFLGVTSEDKGWIARCAEASPTTYISGNEPPVLIIHGSKDPAVSPLQARLLRNALEEAGDIVHMYYIPGGVHAMGGSLLMSIVREFLDYYIKGITTVAEPKVPAECFRNRNR